MKCTPLVVGGQQVGWTCGRRPPTKQCRACGREANRSCDYKLRGKLAGKTCDAPLCDVHAHEMGTHQSGKYKGDRIDYCPGHAEAHAKEQAAMLPGLGK